MQEQGSDASPARESGGEATQPLMSIATRDEATTHYLALRLLAAGGKMWTCWALERGARPVRRRTPMT